MKKASFFNNIQAVEIQITLQDGHHLVNYNESHENLQAFVSLDKRGRVWISKGLDNRGSDNRGCTVVRYVHI